MLRRSAGTMCGHVLELDRQLLDVSDLVKPRTNVGRGSAGHGLWTGTISTCNYVHEGFARQVGDVVALVGPSRTILHLESQEQIRLKKSLLPMINLPFPPQQQNKGFSP